MTGPKTLSIDELKRLRRMGRKMKSAYVETDAQFAKGTDGMKISCIPGCASCCYLLTLISLPEGVAIAEHFLSDVQRRNLVPDLMRRFWEQLRHVEVAEVTTIRDAYFRKKVPCTFLDTATNRCTIYSVRPGACRYHAVVSPPELCSPDSYGDVAKVVDTLEQAYLLSEANRVSHQTKLPLFIAPLPVVMLWAFKLLIEGREVFDAALQDPDLGAMDLLGWLKILDADEHRPVRAVQVAAEPSGPHGPPAI